MKRLSLVVAAMMGLGMSAAPPTAAGQMATKTREARNREPIKDEQ